MPAQQAITDVITLFPSDLGWIALISRRDAVRRITFGYESPDEALSALPAADVAQARVGRAMPKLIARLQAFARGARDDFRDVPLDLGPRTSFQQRVIAACRRIPQGQTATYGELAQTVGAPRAARAVGSVMSSNAVPLIVPCHRVLGAGGRLGGYSCPQGLVMKKRLLALESSPQAGARRGSARGAGLNGSTSGRTTTRAASRAKSVARPKEATKRKAAAR